MINATQFGKALKKHEFDFFSGVPCSSLKSLINYAINDLEYIAAANEGDAVAIAAGAALGGRKSVVLMQNSGLTNATSPLSSLTSTFEIPILGFVSLRGEVGTQDEPQHKMMGKITHNFLDVMNIDWDYLSADTEEAIAQLQYASDDIDKGQSFFFVVKRGSFDEVKLKKEPQKTGDITRLNALKKLVSLRDKNTVLVATTGYTGRELYSIEDHPQHLYMVGSMGCVNSLGLGIALAKPKKEVVVIDGDGALLMRMGALATNAHYKPKNMCHVLLDNGLHESTGGQETVSSHVEFATVAEACGYPKSIKIDTLDELDAQIKEWRKKPQLTFIHLKTAPGIPAKLPRPDITPPEVTERFYEFLSL